jgi:hypothetical protein
VTLDVMKPTLFSRKAMAIAGLVAPAKERSTVPDPIIITEFVTFGKGDQTSAPIAFPGRILTHESSSDGGVRGLLS